MSSFTYAIESLYAHLGGMFACANSVMLLTCTSGLSSSCKAAPVHVCKRKQFLLVSHELLIAFTASGDKFGLKNKIFILGFACEIGSRGRSNGWAQKIYKTCIKISLYYFCLFIGPAFKVRPRLPKFAQVVNLVLWNVLVCLYHIISVWSHLLNIK